MKIPLLIAFILFGALSAEAQTYTVTGNAKGIGDVQVVRTDTGDMTHIKATFAVPQPTRDVPLCNEAFFYCMILASKTRMTVTQTQGEDSPHGFVAVRQNFAPGEKVTLEVDIPKSLEDAAEAHLHIGCGVKGGAYWPSPNLLVHN